MIIGPMFSGKTNTLILKHNEIKSNKKTFVVDYNIDPKLNLTKHIIKSHDNLSIETMLLSDLSYLLENTISEFVNSDYIFINEAQFFPNLKKYILSMIDEYNKNIILCGLDSDFKREKFGEIWDLIPHTDNLIKLSGKCNNCNNYSLYSHRLSCNKEQYLIESSHYIPLCRSCYKNLN